MITNFIKYNYKPRYANEFGMELYDYSIDFQTNKLLSPYGDYSKGLFRKDKFGFDVNNVFVFKNNDIDYYNPCGIAEYALICFEKICNSKTEVKQNKKKFTSQVNWLVENLTILDNKYAVWFYNYPNSQPFYSGISQGMIISVLLRAYQYFDEEKYFNLAWQAFNFLNLNVKDGGIKFTEHPYYCWFEEYLDSPKILNGHIYSLLGIYDLYRVTKDKEVKKVFDLGIADIKNNIKAFDLGFFTKYDAGTSYPANNSYHYTHITLFSILFKITNDTFFEKYSKKFLKYHTKFFYKIINFIYLLYLTIVNKLKNT